MVNLLKSEKFMYEATVFGQNWVLSAGSSFPFPENSFGIRMSHPASGSTSEEKSLSEVKAVPKWRGVHDLGPTQGRRGHFILYPGFVPANLACLGLCCTPAAFPAFHSHVDNGLNGELFPASSKSLWPQQDGQGHTECHQCPLNTGWQGLSCHCSCLYI